MAKQCITICTLFHMRCVTQPYRATRYSRRLYYYTDLCWLCPCARWARPSSADDTSPPYNTHTHIQVSDRIERHGVWRCSGVAGRVPTREAGAAELPSLTAALTPPCFSCVEPWPILRMRTILRIRGSRHTRPLFTNQQNTVVCSRATNDGVSRIPCQLYKR